MKANKEFRRVFLIAGSEPLGSAGMQADIKAISACGAFAAAALTTIVNEDTHGVKGIFAIPEDMVSGQSHSYLSDVKAHCIKTGMLFSRSLIECVANVLTHYREVPMVIDPVMVDTNGYRLIEEDAVEAYKQFLFPLAAIITPNSREAELLLHHPITIDSANEDLKTLCQWGNAVIVKSVHQGNKLYDFFYDPKTKIQRVYTKERIDTHNVNGSGDSFASAIAAYIARGYHIEDAVERAEHFIQNAISEGAQYAFGCGFGPVCQLYESVVDNEREDIAYQCSLLEKNFKKEQLIEEQKTLCSKLLKHPDIIKAKVILGYIAKEGQIDITEAMNLLAKEKRVVVPMMDKNDIYLVEYSVEPGKEPKVFKDYHMIEAALIPFDVVDYEGHWHREDRTLYEKLFFAMVNAHKIAVVSSCRKVGRLPFKAKETPIDEVL